MPVLPADAERLIDLALEEDLFLGDATSGATIDAGARGEGRWLAKEDLVLAGTDVASRVFERLGAGCRFPRGDGARVVRGEWFGIAAGADMVLLDNMDDRTMAEAVRCARGRVLLDASGNMTIQRLAAGAATGVDFVSMGPLTHSAPAVDISFEPRAT